MNPNPSPQSTVSQSTISNQKSAIPHLQFCWLSLDEGDSDPTRFWTYLVSALQTVEGQWGKDAQTLLSGGFGNNSEAILTTLINDLARSPTPVVLILDDLHRIENKEILKSLAFLLDRVPPHVHVMILTRSDPNLPLARYRSRGQLLEIRLADLCFSLEEAHTLLNTAMGLDLHQAPIETLHAKTEGWAAGLQMAGLALKRMVADGSSDAEVSAKVQRLEEFIASFSGSNRFILDYLLEEVLRRQSPEIQEFLIKTSILEGMSGSLCDAVLESKKPISQSILDTLDRANLFLIPLDAERSWYRYHQLFADLLSKRLRQVHPGLEAQLHARASRWYEENQLILQAVEHAFQAGEASRAGQMLEDRGDMILGRGEYRWLLRQIQKIPPDCVQAHGKLFLYQAVIYASMGQLNQAERSLQAFEASSAADQANRRKGGDWVTGSAAAVKALIAIFRGDAVTARNSARLALEKFPEGSVNPWRSHLLIALSHIHEMDENFAESRQYLIDAIEAGKQAGDIYVTLDATAHLVITLCYQGCLKKACDYARQGLGYIEHFGLAHSPEASMVFLAWGYILCEQHHLEEAWIYVQKGMDLCQRSRIPGMLAWAHLVAGRYWIATGDTGNAEQSAHEVARLTKDVEIPAWIVSGCSALLAQAWIREEKLAEAEEVLHGRGIPSTMPLNVITIAEYTAFAGVLVAKGELNLAEDLLERVLERANASGMRRPMLMALIQLALLHEMKGNQQEAVRDLIRALEIGEPEGHLQVFLDEGKALVELLSRVVKQDQHAVFAQKIIDLVGEAGVSPTPSRSVRAGEAELRPAGEFGTLTRREIDVLSLLAEGLSNKEIAQRLYLSLRTVKYHTTNIFTKLNVENRTQAVLRAKASGILL